MTDVPFCAIVPHLFGDDGVRGGAAGRWRPRSGRRERPLARAYRRAGFHAISESTRDDLVAAACRPRADPGDPSRRGQRALHAGAGGAARPQPDLLVRWTAEAL